MKIKNVKAIAAHRGMTLKELGQKTGTHSATFRNWASGRYGANYDKLYRVAKELGCTVGQLVGEEKYIVG